MTDTTERYWKVLGERGELSGGAFGPAYDGGGMSTAAVIRTGDPATNGDAAPERRAVTLLRPIAAPAEIVNAQEATRALVAAALKKDRDFGVIPGTNNPTLLKPGAERVALGFGCYYGDPEIIEREIDHDREVRWTKRKKGGETYEGTSLGLYRYVVRVPVIDRATGLTVGFGIGSCSTMESKYVDRPRDCENTALKMAHKRALVSACLVTFGLSDQFTQDVEDAGAVADDHDATENSGAASEETGPSCPKCGGRMFDNRASKRNPKAPDFKCRSRSCDGVIWPARGGRDAAGARVAQAAEPPADAPSGASAQR